MATLLVPYHLDEYLPDLLGPGTPIESDVVLTGPLTGETAWARYADLHERVARSVRQLLGPVHGTPKGRLTVVTGDCTVSLGTVLGLHRGGLARCPR
jgi:arginase